MSSAPSSAAGERNLGVDIKAGVIIAAAGEFDLHGLVGRQFARDQPKRNAAPCFPRPARGQSAFGPRWRRFPHKTDRYGRCSASGWSRETVRSLALRSPIRVRARRRSGDRGSTASFRPDETDTLMSARPIRVSRNRTSPRRSGVRANSAQTRSAASVGNRPSCPQAASDRGGMRGVGNNRILDGAFGLRLRAGGARNQSIDTSPAMILPIDEWRRRHGHRQDHDHD